MTQQAFNSYRLILKGESDISGQVRPRIEKGSRRFTREVVLLGSYQWNLMVGIVIGMRTSLKNIYGLQNTLTASDFSMIGTYTLLHLKDVKNKSKHYFYDYAPNMFHKIRGIFGIEPDEFLRSVGPEQLVTRLLKGSLDCLDSCDRTSGGKKLLFTSWDREYLVKKVSPAEFSFLRSILRSYYEYVKQQPTTLLTRVLAIF